MRRWHPFVIAITGSVGKTTTKEAVATLLTGTYKVKKTEGNYNTEIGLPLTVLNLTVPRHIWGWPFILMRSIVSSFQQDPHDCFVVEMGADKPGDISYLTALVHPHIALVTNVEKVHLAEGQFKDMQDIQKEKSKIVQCLSEQGLAVLNGDNRYTREMTSMTKAPSLLYGIEKRADVFVIQSQSTINGLSFTIQFHRKQYDFIAPVLGDFFLYAFVPAIAIGLQLHIPITDMQQHLAHFIPPKGRFNPIKGVNGSMLIDSTYNASPSAVCSAVRAFSHIAAQRKIIVLGNMNELGISSQEEHQKLGEVVASYCDILLTVGNDARFISETAAQKRPTLQTHPFEHYREAAEFLKPLLKTGDLVLLKGSQNNVFLEEMVKALMNDPALAQDLLVRQGPEWKNKKN